ncbi:MAG TPA: recombinase family protein [Planctomycetota bacterium]|nr:recombinase family protein [Planctomycetota bacterium]
MATIYGYLRYSSANQNDGISLDIQRNAIKTFIASQDSLRGLPYIECADEAQSGTTLKKRAALARIRADARKDDAVICYKLDRLGRNLADCATLLREWKEKGVNFYSTQEGGGRLVQNILLSVAEDFSDQLSRRMKDAATNLVRKGYASNGACFGYKLQKVDHGKKLVPVPEEAAIVKRIYKLRSKGESTRTIAKLLNSERVPSPNDGLWTTGYIHALLRNERYTGTQYSGYRIFKKGEGLKGKRPRKEWTIHRNAHEAIIDDKTWAAVRALDTNSEHSHPASTRRRALNLLTGFVYCPDCGKPLSVHKTNDQKYYGHSGRDTGVDLPCHARYLTQAKQFHHGIIQGLLQKVFNAAFIEQIVGMFHEEVKRARGTVADVLPPLQQELVRKEKAVQAALERSLECDEEDYAAAKAHHQKLKVERDELKEKIERARSQTSGKLAVVSLADLERQLRERLGLIEQNIRQNDVNQAREFLARLVERIEIDRRKNVVMKVKADWLLADTHAVNIPTGI